MQIKNGEIKMKKELLLKEKDIRKEFDNRIQSLKLSKEGKEELFSKFKECVNNGFQCFYCKERMELGFFYELSFTIDHTIPKNLGGSDEVKNLEFVCLQCNEMKSDKQADWFIKNVKRLKERKRRKENNKAIRTAVKDKRLREAYKDIFQHVQAKKEREG